MGGVAIGGTRPCQSCGRTPTLQIELLKVTGVIVGARTQTLKGSLCRECGIREVGKAATHNLVAGWWGVLAFFMNAFALIRLAMTRRSLGRLAAPGSVHASYPAFATPAAPKPLLRRPATYLAGALALVVVGFGVALVATYDPAERSTMGGCVTIDLVKERIGGTVPCDGDQDAKVVGYVQDGDDCPKGTDGAILEPGRDDALVCVDVDA